MALVNPYCVMDDISDARFRSEFNSDTLGTAVVMGPNICQQHYAYFKPDEAKNGGAYVTVTGSAKKVDDVSKMLLLQDGKVIPIKDIQNLSR